MGKKNLLDELDDEPQQEQVKTKKNKSKYQQDEDQQENDDVNVQFKINKSYAKKFEDKVKRNLIDKAKAMYGADYERKIQQEQDDDESSGVEEDSDGELLNEKLDNKFIETLAKIRSKDPSIYKSQKQFFKEKDFELEKNDKKQSSKQEKMTYADMVRKDALQKMGDEDYSFDEEEEDIPKAKKGKGETIADEQKRLKDEFKFAAKNANDEEDDVDDDEVDADAMFTQKKKSVQQIENENKEYEKFMNKMKNKKEKKGKIQDINVLQNFWGDESKLDDTDKFLRKYIMTKGWVDRDEMGLDEDFEEQDIEQDDEADRFEAKYNFRYEEPNANEVVTYGRKVEGSLRQKDSTRAEKRKERDERKKEEKKQIEEEMKLMKAATKNAILERVQKIQEISGAKDIKADINKLLEEDFDDEKFTKQLEKQFDSDYYEEEDSHIDELKEYEKNIKKQEKQEQEMELEKSFGLGKKQIKQIQKSVKKAAEKDDDEEISSDWSDEEDEEEEDQEENMEEEEAPKQQQDDDKDNVLNIKSNIPLAIKKNLKENEIQAMNQSDKGSDGLYLWWYCDNCKKGIQPGQYRFDCSECPDYTLCKICNEGQFHDHPLKKCMVSKNCVPPTDEEILELLKEYHVCKKCNIKLDDYCSYYQLKSNEDVVLCDECYDTEQIISKKLYKYVEASKVDLEAIAENDPKSLKKHITDEEIQNLVDQYYNLDYEDVITGGIKTRFKYVDVKPDSYGLSDEQLLYADTNTLNKYVSIKKLAPYREDEGFVKAKNLKNKAYIKQIEKSTKINKKIIKKDTDKGLTSKEDLLKLKRKDKKKFLKELSKAKKEKQQKKEEEENKEKPKLVLEDLSKQEKIQVSKNRLKSYGF